MFSKKDIDLFIENNIQVPFAVKAAQKSKNKK